MQALPPGAARAAYTFPEPASLHACQLLDGVFGSALQARRGADLWVLGARIRSCACTVLAVHEVYEARWSDRHKDLAAYLAAYPSERVFRCVHQRDLGRVLQRGVLEGLAKEDTCLTSDVSLALEGARVFGPGCYLLVFELAVGREAVAPYEAAEVHPGTAGAHVCTVVNAERTLFRPQYPDQLLLHLVVELEVYACEPAPPELQRTPMCNPALDMQRARENALASAAGSSVDVGNSRRPPSNFRGVREQITADARNSFPKAEHAPKHAPCSLYGVYGNAAAHAADARSDAERSLQHAPCSLYGVYGNATAHAADELADADRSLQHATAGNMCRLGSGFQSACEKMTTHAAMGMDLCTDASFALLHATEARLCAADIFWDTSTSPVVDAVGCGSREIAETYACDFVPKFVVCSEPAESTPDTSDADARCGRHAAPASPQNCSKSGRTRTRARSPNMVRCSGLDCGAQVVMRNMIQPFKFCEGERGHVWHVHRGKRPIFFVIAQNMNVSVRIVEINSRRKNYHAPCMILMLQRFQLEQCADVVE